MSGSDDETPSPPPPGTSGLPPHLAGLSKGTDNRGSVIAPMHHLTLLPPPNVAPTISEAEEESKRWRTLSDAQTKLADPDYDPPQRTQSERMRATTAVDAPSTISVSIDQTETRDVDGSARKYTVYLINTVIETPVRVRVGGQGHGGTTRQVRVSSAADLPPEELRRRLRMGWKDGAASPIPGESSSEEEEEEEEEEEQEAGKLLLASLSLVVTFIYRVFRLCSF